MVRIHRHGAAGRLHQRVAVGRGLGGGAGGDHGAGAGAVLDHERLAETLLELLRDRAREQSVPPPGANGTRIVTVRAG